MYQGINTGVGQLLGTYEPQVASHGGHLFSDELLALEQGVQPVALEMDASTSSPGAEGTHSDRGSPSPIVHRLETTRLQVRFFGSFAVSYGGYPLQRRGLGKGWEILKYLASNFEQPVHRDQLIETLWPGVDLAIANNRLKVAMHSLRRALANLGAPDNLIMFNSGVYRFNPQRQVISDVALFRRARQMARVHENNGDVSAALRCCNEAISYYRGEFLAEDRSTDWTMAPRAELRSIALDVFDHRSRLYLQQGAHGQAIEDMQRILAEDNLREDIYRRIIGAYAELGQRGTAAHWFERCRSALKERLGCEPQAETIALYQLLNINSRAVGS